MKMLYWATVMKTYYLLKWKQPQCWSGLAVDLGKALNDYKSYKHHWEYSLEYNIRTYDTRGHEFISFFTDKQFRCFGEIEFYSDGISSVEKFGKIKAINKKRAEWLLALLRDAWDGMVLDVAKGFLRIDADFKDDKAFDKAYNQFLEDAKKVKENELRDITWEEIIIEAI